MTDYKTVEVQATDGTMLTVRVPTRLPTPARVALLERAWARVRPAGNWKRAIDAEVTVTALSELTDILEAIEFYTATEGAATPTAQPWTFRITAPGYYAGPAN